MDPIARAHESATTTIRRAIVAGGRRSAQRRTSPPNRRRPTRRSEPGGWRPCASISAATSVRRANGWTSAWSRSDVALLRRARESGESYKFLQKPPESSTQTDDAEASSSPNMSLVSGAKVVRSAFAKATADNLRVACQP